MYTLYKILGVLRDLERLSKTASNDTEMKALILREMYEEGLVAATL